MNLTYVKQNLDVNFDSIIFDCDGVLIDITQSYDLAIQKTAQYFLEKFGIKNPLPVRSEIIDGFKATGGFNDEVDLTYAAILAIYAAHKTNRDPKKFVFEVIANADSSGITSVEHYVDQICDISEIKSRLDYPSPHHKNPLYAVFDQLFYGPKLYRQIFGKNSEFSEPALIDNDIVIVTSELVKKLKKKVGSKIAIVSGRGLQSIRYSLKGLLDEFDLKNSVFLEDQPREMAKPNPKSLISSICGMKAKKTLYVGDSMEDYIMAQKATESGFDTTFCGIVGTSKNPQKKRILFEKNNVPIILDSIQLLPKVLNLE